LRVLIGRVGDAVQPRGRSVHEGDEEMKYSSHPYTPSPAFRIHVLIAHDKIFIVSNYCISSATLGRGCADSDSCMPHAQQQMRFTVVAVAMAYTQDRAVVYMNVEGCYKFILYTIC
jgi:hypothetical protein